MNNQTNLNPNSQNNGFNNQHRNIEMNNGVNNTQFTNINRDQNQNYYNRQTNKFNNYTNNKKNGPKNKKIITIIIIALVVLIGIFGITKLVGGSSSGNGYTVNIGEELKIKELDGVFDFSIEVLSPVEKKHIVKEGYFGKNDEYDAYAIKVNVKNNGNSELSLSDLRLYYQLLDSTDNEIEPVNSYDSFNFDGAIQDTIASGASATGYLYFFDLLADENTPAVDVNKVNKLEIGVLMYLTNGNNDTITGNYESYFVKLK